MGDQNKTSIDLDQIEHLGALSQVQQHASDSIQHVNHQKRNEQADHPHKSQASVHHQGGVWHHTKEVFERIEDAFMLLELSHNVIDILEHVRRVISTVVTSVAHTVPVIGTLLNGLGYVSHLLKLKKTPQPNRRSLGIKVTGGMIMVSLAIFGVVFPPLGGAMVVAGLGVSASLSGYRAWRAFKKMRTSSQASRVASTEIETEHFRERSQYKANRYRDHAINASIGLLSVFVIGASIIFPPLAIPLIGLVLAASVCSVARHFMRLKHDRGYKRRMRVRKVLLAKQKPPAKNHDSDKVDKPSNKQQQQKVASSGKKATVRPVVVPPSAQVSNHLQSKQAKVESPQDKMNTTAPVTEKSNLSVAEPSAVKVMQPKPSAPATKHRDPQHKADGKEKLKTEFLKQEDLILEQMATHHHPARSFSDAHPDIRSSTLTDVTAHKKSAQKEEEDEEGGGEGRTSAHRLDSKMDNEKVDADKMAVHTSQNDKQIKSFLQREDQVYMYKVHLYDNISKPGAKKTASASKKALLKNEEGDGGKTEQKEKQEDKDGDGGKTEQKEKQEDKDGDGGKSETDIIEAEETLRF